eukprot:255585_1
MSHKKRALTFHPDCVTNTTYFVIYTGKKCILLVSGFGRSNCKRYVIPLEVYKIVRLFVGTISLETEAKNLSKDIIQCRFGECKAGMNKKMYLINYMPNNAHHQYGMPYFIIDIKKQRASKFGSGRLILTINSPFVSSTVQQYQILRGDTQLVDVTKCEYVKYLISHFESDTNELVCFDEHFEEIYWKVSSNRSKIYEKLKQMIKMSEEEQNIGKDLYAITLKTFTRDRKGNYFILQIVIDVVMESNTDCSSNTKSQKNKPSIL